MATTTISVTAEAHALLKEAKEPGESFSDVILRTIVPPARTAGELLDRMEKAPRPGISLERLEYVLEHRGRRSPRR
ncbi:MAG TPA: antitoxin VapB family protein [Verrucomicrobiota bacterium]|nr:antitoxin VapB family protein [Verrucomicrobiota bacterium]